MFEHYADGDVFDSSVPPGWAPLSASGLAQRGPKATAEFTGTRDAIALAGGPKRVITLSDPAAADYGVTLSQPTPDRAPGALDETIALLADGRRSACARTPPCPCSRPPRPTASWKAAPSINALFSPSTSASGTAAASLFAHDMPPGTHMEVRQ